MHGRDRRALGHFVNTPSFGLIVFVSQKGHRTGGRGLGGRVLCSATCGAGETTCGITSPARSDDHLLARP